MLAVVVCRGTCMTTAEALNAAAFQFVQGLVTDLDRDDLELPDFPDDDFI